MQYALLGDLHSHYKCTKSVLEHIKEVAPQAEIIGLGDLFECTIGKKKAQKIRNAPVEVAAILEKEFTNLLTFPSIIGNQEERIALVTGDKRFLQYENVYEIENATLMHGHQFDWDEDFNPTFPPIETPLLFFGHSHHAAIYVNGERQAVPYNKPLSIGEKCYQINVGPVVENMEWCLYDSEVMSVTFMQAIKFDPE
ncbi:metallophosphatase family protein [Solibacillus sp. R5-41]|uniref:metallophosphoesterase family protein n=1 Tax=Solibacillus sp. R5-41 TaxID=2048654 RepID=UPI000C1259CF|nr:metallophosphoesterase family protein [Solibacillus sp. R5-41]ATP41899.1 metallophosphatase family protein [Solibacillus sp. R5-41]